MDSEKYNNRAKIINQISQLTEKMNSLVIELQETENDFESKNLGKLNKGLSFMQFFVINERKFMKKLRKDHYKKIEKK